MVLWDRPPQVSRVPEKIDSSPVGVPFGYTPQPRAHTHLLRGLSHRDHRPTRVRRTRGSLCPPSARWPPGRLLSEKPERGSCLCFPLPPPPPNPGASPVAPLAGHPPFLGSVCHILSFHGSHLLTFGLAIPNSSPNLYFKTRGQQECTHKGCAGPRSVGSPLRAPSCRVNPLFSVPPWNFIFLF